MSEHTPGPWHLEPYSYGFDLVREGVKPGSYGGWFIELRALDVDDEYRANACLIAAAPDMLRALQEMEAILDFDAEISPCACFPDPDGIRNAVRMGREAIAKATGADLTSAEGAK